jgi:hypothetical protein
VPDIKGRLATFQMTVAVFVVGGLSKLARSGTMGGGQTVHVHHSPTYHVQTIDGDGMQAVLEKHDKVLTKHVEKTVRKMNKG